MISAEELLAGATLTYDIEIPERIRAPGAHELRGPREVVADRVGAVQTRVGPGVGDGGSSADDAGGRRAGPGDAGARAGAREPRGSRTETAPGGTENGSGTVRLRPLTVHDLQLISRAAKENDSLLATLMVQRSMVEPAVTVAQVSAMHVGLVEFLVDRVNAISGITATSRTLNEASHAPLAKAAFILSREFGWTPEEVARLTLGQVLLHLEMLKEQAQG